MDRPAESQKAALAIVCNSVPPYREHVHLRIAREMPEVKLWTVCTHEGTDSRWKFDPPPEINTVSFGRDPGIPDRAGINVGSWRKAGRIIRWAKESQIAAMVVLGYNDIGRVRIIRWCRNHAIPCYIWTDSNIRADRLPPFKAAVKKLIVGRVLSWASGALPCGLYGRLYFQKYGVPDERIFHFPNEPDYQIIRNVASFKLEEMRNRFSLSPQRRRLVYSGRLVDVKRVDLLIDAFARIAPERPEWDLLIIGDGPRRAALQQRVPEQLEARVIWTGFLDDQPAVSALYRLSDVLVLPSDYEPWALVLNEAAAAGLAIVCSDVVGASAELVRNGINGRIFARGNLDQLIEALLDVTNPQHIDTAKQASEGVLDQWSRIGDPIKGLRQALQASGVIPAAAHATGA